MLKVSVKDFGPIIEGTVNLKPLTIFIGPSNSGKSYMAMLIYSLMQSAGFPGMPRYLQAGRGYDRSVRAQFRRSFAFEFGRIEVNEDLGSAIGQWVKELETGTHGVTKVPFAKLPEKVQRYVDELVNRAAHSMGPDLNNELQKCIGDIPGLVRRAHNPTQLEVHLEQDQPLLKSDFLRSNAAVVADHTKLDLSAERVEVPLAILHDLHVAIRERPTEDLLPAYSDLMGHLAGAFRFRLFEKFPQDTYYLPAARSGIAQAHRLVASILVDQASIAGIRSLEIPTLPGITADFIKHMLVMEPRRVLRTDPGLEDVAAFMEQKVIHGRIAIERGPHPISPSEISYEPLMGQPQMGKFPLQRTSSMVSELALVILFLRHMVEPGDLVILEEPESHLHPASQRQMARGIARLVNKGVRVIITTHSDYLIAQLNNLLKLGYASRQKRSKEGYDTEDCLKSEDVGAYLFDLDDEKGGSVVKKLSITPDVGIDETEFAAVTEALYEETISLQRIRAKQP